MSLELHFNRLDEWPAAGLDEAALRAAAVAAFGTGEEPEGEVSFTFVSRSEIASLNDRYLCRDGATDVIAFELGEEGRLLGDVYICPEVASANAVARGEAPGTEILRLVIHGALHVLGMDHSDGPDRESGPMWARQEELLRGLPDG